MPQPMNFCIICANMYSSPDFIPLSFPCGHTFCSTCVKKNTHYKTFGDRQGLCIVDRTEVIQGVEGRVNKCLFQYLSTYEEQVKAEMLMAFQLQKAESKNEMLSYKIEGIEEKCVALQRQYQRLEDKLFNMKQTNGKEIDLKEQKLTKQVKEMEEKLEKYRKINEIKQARLDQLRYLVKKLKAESRQQN